MNVLLVMIPLSVGLLIGAVAAFFWAVDHDQFDDMCTPALLPLSEDLSEPLKSEDIMDDVSVDRTHLREGVGP